MAQVLRLSPPVPMGDLAGSSPNSQQIPDSAPASKAGATSDFQRTLDLCLQDGLLILVWSTATAVPLVARHG
eukprot:1162024-Pelagomonas_calceolata.AAC.13